MTQLKVLLLNGSPKSNQSTSLALGNYVINQLQKRGFLIETVHIVSMLKNQQDLLYQKTSEADVIILTFPLYVDCLPSHVIKWIENVPKYMKKVQASDKRMMAIVNCGFPEPFHADTALMICEHFAKTEGFKWIGGFAVGAGPAINGKSIDLLGGMTRKMIKGFDLAVDEIVKNEVISEESIRLVRSKMMPYRLYTLAGNYSFKLISKKLNAKSKLYDQPYFEGVIHD